MSYSRSVIQQVIVLVVIYVHVYLVAIVLYQQLVSQSVYICCVIFSCLGIVDLIYFLWPSNLAVNLLLWVSTGRHNTGDKGVTVWIEMAIAAIGNMKNFDPEKGYWMEYEQLQHYFLANNIEPDHQKSTLITVIGYAAYALLQQLVAPEKLGDKYFADLS